MTSTKYLTHFESNYKALAATLREQIRSGELQPGDRLPSFSEGRANGISQRTFEHAHAMLEREGLIRRVPRRGMFVEGLAEPLPRNRTSTSSMMRNTVIVVAAQRDLQKVQQHLAGWQGTEIVDHLASLSYNVMVLSLDSMMNREIDHIYADPPAALVFLENAVDLELGNVVRQALLKVGRPVVLIGDDAWMDGFDRIASDHVVGSTEMTRRLISMGASTILNVWPLSAEHYWLAAKWQGFRGVIETAGLPLIDPVIIPERIVEKIDKPWFDDEVRRFYGYLQPFLTGDRRIDAIMAHTDYRVGIIAAAIRLSGLTPNVDVMLTGYDATYKWLTVLDAWERTRPLMTADRRDNSTARLAAEITHKRVLSAAGKPERILVPPTIIDVSEQ